MVKKLQSKEISQIHRISGQVAGIEKMLRYKVKIENVLQQIEAVKGNLTFLEKRILKKSLKSLNFKEIERLLGYVFRLNSGS